MDWKKTFDRGQWAIHATLLIAITVGIGSTIFALRLNHLQITEEERGMKINSLLLHLKKDMSFEKIGKLLAWAESDRANDKIRELNQKIAQTEELLETKASKDLSLAIRTFNRLINNNSGMSDPSDALKVLGSKVDSLNQYAQSRRYQNIGLISERMRERLDQLTPKTVGGSLQVSYLRSDIERMRRLVNGSTLTENEKSALESRFSSMYNEIELLSSLNSQARDLKAHVNQGAIALSQWMIEVEKKASDLQGSRFRKQNQLVLLLSGMVAFMILSWIGLAYLFRWQKQRMGKQIEMEVKGVIEKGIMGDQRFMMDHYSDFTRTEIIRLLDELKVKLNLGSMLHSGLPFAGCMVDQNFKLNWFNHLFLEQFYLSEEEVRSEGFNWDYLRDHLGLEEDPVYQALVNKLAGIYPVRIKQDEIAPPQPFEMYVTPIAVNREERVMVFFYPLVSVKEAIQEQVNLSRQGLGKFTSFWRNDALGEAEIMGLEREFKNLNLSDVFDDLISIFERLNNEKKECFHTINRLEKENARFADALENARMMDEQKRGIVRQEFQLAQELRNSFLGSIERIESLLHITRTVLQQNDELRSDAHQMHQMTSQMAKKSKETNELITSLEAIKSDYKKIKFELLEIRAKLISMNNSIFSQLPELSEPQKKLTQRYKEELSRLDLNVTMLDKKLTQLDVYFTKLNMIHEKTQIEQSQFNFLTSQKDHEIKETIIALQKSQGVEETRIIENFGHLHSLLKRNMSHSLETSEIRQEPTDQFLS
jgi:hypothetical protein